MFTRLVAILLVLIQPAVFPAWCICASRVGPVAALADACCVTPAAPVADDCGACDEPDAADPGCCCCAGPMPTQSVPPSDWPAQKTSSPADLLGLEFLPSLLIGEELPGAPPEWAQRTNRLAASHQFDRPRQSLLCVWTT